MPPDPTPRSRPARAPQRLAVLDQHAGSWCLLVLRVNGTPAVEQATSFAAADASGLAWAIARARADRLVRLIPLGQTLCRPVAGATSPDGDDRQVAAAMTLIAEAQLGSGLPAHRRAAGMLPVGGMVAAGWTGSAVDDPPGKIASLSSAVWVAPVAALAALAKAASAPIALVAQRESGAIAVVAGGSDPAKCVARVTREDGSELAGWRESIETAATSAASALGADQPQVGDVSGALALRLLKPDGSRAFPAGISGVPSDRSDASWLDRFGLALGAGLAAADPHPATSSLLAMTPEPVVPPQPILLRMVDSLARPSRAATAIAVCVVVVLGWPLAAAWLRYDRLSAVAAADRSEAADETTARKEADFYQLLRDRRWPMTKLLADLTASMPTGITLETATIEVGQKVRITGTAESSQVLSEWRSALAATRIFDDVRKPSEEASSGSGVKFQLEARVAQPLTVGGKTIATPSATQPAATTSSSAPSATRPAAAPASDRDDPSTARNRRRAAPASAKSVEPPPPLTDAEIESMDNKTAMSEFSLRRKFASTPGLDEATKTRLNDEATKCQARMKATAGGGQ